MQSVGNTINVHHYTKIEFEAVSTTTAISSTPSEDPTDPHYVNSVIATLTSQAQNMARTGIESIPFNPDGDTPVNAALAILAHYGVPVAGMSVAEFAGQLSAKGVTGEDLGQLALALCLIPVGTEATELRPLSTDAKSPNPLRSFI
jgi:hypothetical protein